MIDFFQTVLVLAPHPDDGEFGCGGTIARLVDSGATVHYVAFSLCEESVPEGLPKDVLLEELYAATRLLGLPRERVNCRRYPVRRFTEHRQDILEELVKLRKTIRPDLVFIPSLKDVHQDHHVIAEEGVRAFKNVSIFSYELLWNIISFEHTCFVQLTESQLDRKVAAVGAYASQRARRYSSPTVIRSQAVMRGIQVNQELAEVFEVVRLNV